MSSAFEGRRDRTSLALQALAENECARFRNRNLRQPGARRRVHAVEHRNWIGGLVMPVPACHQPLDPVSLAGHSQAVTLAVDCERCLTRDEHPFPPLVAIDGDQLPLALETSDDPPPAR